MFLLVIAKGKDNGDLSMSTRHIGTDVIQHHSLLTVAIGGEWSTSRSGRWVSWEAFRHPLSRMRDEHHRRCGRYGKEKNMLPHARIQTQDRSAHSLGNILSYIGTLLPIVDN